jgi:hypothetical protein
MHARLQKLSNYYENYLQELTIYGELIHGLIVRQEASPKAREILQFLLVGIQTHAHSCICMHCVFTYFFLGGVARAIVLRLNVKKIVLLTFVLTLLSPAVIVTSAVQSTILRTRISQLRLQLKLQNACALKFNAPQKMH